MAKVGKDDVVSKVLDSADGLVQVGMTIEEVLEVAGSQLDRGGIEGTAIFQVKGDKRWWVGSVEFCILEATPEFVADRQQQLKDEEDK